MLQELQNLTDESVEQFYTYGYAQYKFGNTKQAIDVFQQLCASKPFESRFWFALGACYQDTRQYELALKAWAMAALTDPSDPYPHFHAAECACSLGQLGQMRLSLDEAQKRIANDPHHPLQGRIPILKLTR